AGVERARCLMAASDSDAGNTFIVLAAKSLNPGLFVVSRAALPENEARMLRAGAERVVSPYAIAGRRMALSALQPLILDFVEALASSNQKEQIVAEIGVTPESGLAGQTIERSLESSPDIIVLGLQRASGETIVGPRRDSVLSEGDRLIVLGEESQVARIAAAKATPERSVT
ncbi:MAG TPA: NAD-binding protein, partial [Dehalococcoidia bacterium]|nr:NAD-binding protein [Dehalococcoidia bacterium]